jgi:hypothetical protein
MSRKSQRRYRKRPDRRVWVFSELNHDLRPEQIANILTAAGLEQARLEAEAARDHERQHARRHEAGTDPKEVADA